MGRKNKEQKVAGQFDSFENPVNDSNIKSSSDDYPSLGLGADASPTSPTSPASPASPGSDGDTSPTTRSAFESEEPCAELLCQPPACSAPYSFAYLVDATACLENAARRPRRLHLLLTARRISVVSHTTAWMMCTGSQGF